MDYSIIIKNFLDSEGKLKDYPAKRKMQVACLFYLIDKFDKEKQYKEIEVNFLLKKWNTFGDHATLRRDLVDGKFLLRTDDCRTYWVNPETPKPSDFGFEY